LPGTVSRYIVLSGAWLYRDAEDPVATGPDLRIGDADREAAAAVLREHYALGRNDEVKERTGAGRVLAAVAAARWL
jgi:hypothetical protein